MNLLVTTDGSQPSRHVLPHAVRLARVTGARLTLVRALNPFTDLSADFAPRVEDAVRLRTEQWEAEMRAMLAEAGAEGQPLVVQMHQREDVHDCLLRTVKELGVDVVAMNSRGTGALRHALLGSVALGVLGGAGVPVLLTSDQTAPPAGGGPYHVAVASDGSPSSLDVISALQPALEAAGEAKVTMIRVVEPRSGRANPEAEREACRQQLESLRGQFPANVTVDTHVGLCEAQGCIPDSIIRAAKEAGAEAIAMATHGDSALRHLIAGSVALDVLKASPLPVILSRSAK